MTEQTPKYTPCRHGYYSNRVCEICAEVDPLKSELATAQSKLAALESDITRHVQIATEQANEIAALEQKRREDVRKCESLATVRYGDSNRSNAAAAIRVAFPEVFP